MDLSFRTYRWFCALVMGVLLLAASCTKERGGAVPQLEEPGALLFNVLAEPASKLAYEGVHTSFENDEKVGCIIAAKAGENYEFKSVTQWKYNNGVLLMLTEDDEYVAKHINDDLATQGYVHLLNPDMEYAFLFFYPYNETDLPTSETWKSYPVTVQTDFSVEGAFNASDHLWARHTDNQAQYKAGKTYDVNLEFQKKTATVEIHCDHGTEYTIDEVWIDTIYGTKGVQTSMHMNLTSGTFTTSDTGGRYDGVITPGKVAEEDGSIHESGYRMIFVPQTILSWRLHARVTENEVETTYNIPLEDKLRVLEEGKLYIFHIAKAGEGSILIKDWNSDNTDNLIGEEIAVPTDLTMWAEADHDPDKIDDGVVIKSGETLIIRGENFWATDHCIVDKVQLVGAKVSDFELSEDSGDGYRTITLTLPDEAMDGPVYLVMDSGVMVSPGSIYTVKPEVTGLTPATVDMNADGRATSITLTGENLDLVVKVIFGGDYSATAEPSDDGKSLTADIPEFAQTGNLQLLLNNGLVVDSEQLFTVENAHEEIKVTSVTGRYTAGETITVKGLHLNEVGLIHLKGEGDGVIVLDKVQSGFSISDDGTTIRFAFPAEARDGDMVFYQGASTYVIHTEPYVTLVPSYMEVQKIDDKLYVYGKDLDVVKTVVLNGNTMDDASVKSSEICFEWDEVDEGKITLTTYNGKQVVLPYDFTPKISVSSIESPLGYVYDNVQHIVYAAPGIEITINGSNLHLADEVRILDKVITDLTVSGDNTKLTFVFPDVEYDGSINLAVTEDNTSFSVGDYVLKNNVAGDVGITDVTGFFHANQTVLISGTGLSEITSVIVSGVGGENPVTLTRSSGSLWLQNDILYFNFPQGASLDNGEAKIAFYVDDVIVHTYVAGAPSISGITWYDQLIIVTGDNLEFVTSVDLNNSTGAFEYDIDGYEDAIVLNVNNFTKGITGYVNLTVKHDYDKLWANYDFRPTVSTDLQTLGTLNPGDEFTIEGTNLDLVDCVLFKDEYGNISVPYMKEAGKPMADAPGTSLTITVPAGAATGPLTLRCIDQTEQNKVTTSTELTIGSGVDNQPAVTSIERNGWTNLYINGTDLDKVTSLSLNGGSLTENTDFSKNASQIQIYLGSGNIDNQYKLLKGKVLLNGSIEAEYDFTPTASFSDNNPKNVGDQITLTGTDLDLVDNVVFTTSSGKHAGTKQSYTSTVITVIIPNDAVSGPVWLDCSDYANTQVEVGVIAIGSQEAPVISSITRSGNYIYVNGSGFTNLTSVVLNNGTLQPDTNYTVNNQGTIITIDVYSGVNQGITGSVSVANESGSSSSGYNFSPNITSIDKLSVSVGETITITGKNLDLVQSVIFVNGVTANNVTAQAEILTFEVPSGSQSGKITLSCVDGGTTRVTSEDDITIVDTPVVDPDPGTGDGEETVLWSGTQALGTDLFIEKSKFNSVDIGDRLIITLSQGVNSNGYLAVFLANYKNNNNWGDNNLLAQNVDWSGVTKEVLIELELTEDILTRIKSQDYNGYGIYIYSQCYNGIINCLSVKTIKQQN